MDIKLEYEYLTKELEKCLPLKAFPIRELVQELRKNGTIITLNSELKISNVINSGDISGIICEIELSTNNDEVILCGLVHLKFSSNHSLYKEIIEYQIKRGKRIKKLNQ